MADLVKLNAESVIHKHLQSSDPHLRLLATIAYRAMQYVDSREKQLAINQQDYQELRRALDNR